MKIALIFTPLKLEKNWSALLFQDRYVGVMPPLSLAYVAAVAEKAGHEVIIIDAVAEKLSLEDIIVRIRQFSPVILGFTITTYGFHQTLDWIKKIREKVNLPVMVGGWHLSLYPKETMKHSVIDYAICGKAEAILPYFLREKESGGSLSTIGGIAYRKDGEIILNPKVTSVEKLDTVPFPARHLLKNEKYFNILSNIKNFTVMLSAVGCPYRCIFCDLNTKKFRMRSAMNFVDEIEINYKEFKIREFDIYDSSFTIDKDRVRQICSEIIKRKLKIRWMVRSRVDNLDKNLLKEMSMAGCAVIMYGIESADPEILKASRKNIDIDLIRNAVRWSRECGIKTLGFFMIGLPGETYETAMKTIKFSTKLALDYVQFTKLVPFPNTEIYNMLMEQGFGDYWREFTLDSSKERELPLINANMNSNEAMVLVKKAYINFYLRPSYILKAISRIKSPLEFNNSLKAAVGLFLNRQPGFD